MPALTKPRTRAASVVALALASLFACAGVGSAELMVPPEWINTALQRIGQQLARLPVSTAPQTVVEGKIKATVDRSGRILRVEIDTSTGSNILDRAALDAVRDASPLPSIPWAKGETVTVYVPLRFNPRPGRRSGLVLPARVASPAAVVAAI